MKVNYKYNGPSVCVPKNGAMTLGFSPDLSRSEKVSFHGKLKNPLAFRDAMLMLREIVISDSKIEKKPREEFYNWLEEEIERHIREHEKYAPDVREQLKKDMNLMFDELEKKNDEINMTETTRLQLCKKLDSLDAWKDYHTLEREFWKFIRNRDSNLWFVLDPVITVHPDIVSFEAFSLDESIYGCLSIEMDEFIMLSEPKLGTTNIDFSAKLAKSMERFRTYSNVELSVNPDGFAVDTGIVPEHIEKKIDLPESWVKGFNQVSAAATLSGIDIDISPVDLYDICSFMRRHKANKSPRYMKWVLEKNKPVRIIFEPFGTELVLKSIYHGDKNREEKIWGRRRWLVAEKLIPLARSFKIKLLGFGMPQFIVADMGKMKMTIGFSSWSSNDWVKGTAFNIMSGFVGDGNYPEIYSLLQKNRFMKLDDIYKESNADKPETTSGIGSLLKRGEAYFDEANGGIRFRKLFAEPIPDNFYETTPLEFEVKKLAEGGLDKFSMISNPNGSFIFKNKYSVLNKHYHNYKYRNTETYNTKYKYIETELSIDEDGQIENIKCECAKFNKGPRNISSPCEHILALYTVSAKFTRLKPKRDGEYKINDIMEMLL